MWHPHEMTGDMEVRDEFTEQIFIREESIGIPRSHPIDRIVYDFPRFMLDFMIRHFDS